MEKPKTQSFFQKSDVKRRLLLRVIVNTAVTVVGIVLLTTYKLWSNAQLPLAWVMAFLGCTFIGLLFELYLIKLIRSLSYVDSHIKVFGTVISIKKIYKKMELCFSIAIALLMLWISMTPQFSNIVDTCIIWALFTIALIIELVLYSKNIKVLNSLSDWRQYYLNNPINPY